MLSPFLLKPLETKKNMKMNFIFSGEHNQLRRGGCRRKVAAPPCRRVKLLRFENKLHRQNQNSLLFSNPFLKFSNNHTSTRFEIEHNSEKKRRKGLPLCRRSGFQFVVSCVSFCENGRDSISGDSSLLFLEADSAISTSSFPVSICLPPQFQTQTRLVCYYIPNSNQFVLMNLFPRFRYRCFDSVMNPIGLLFLPWLRLTFLSYGLRKMLLNSVVIWL